MLLSYKVTCSGNLGNIAVELIKLILEHGGLKHLQVQVEGKSKACGVGSKSHTYLVVKILYM